MIGEVSAELVRVLNRATPDLAPWVEIHSLSNAESVSVPERKLILALISVEEHDHLRNRPLVEGATGLVRAPLSLRLHYLVTYIGEHDEAQLRLARVIQVFHTTPIIEAPELDAVLAEKVESLVVRLVPTTHDERNQVWGALGRAGRLSLFYTVDVAAVSVLERDGAGRVNEHRLTYVGMS